MTQLFFLVVWHISPLDHSYQKFFFFTLQTIKKYIEIETTWDLVNFVSCMYNFFVRLWNSGKFFFLEDFQNDSWDFFFFFLCLRCYGFKGFVLMKQKFIVLMYLKKKLLICLQRLKINQISIVVNGLVS